MVIDYVADALLYALSTQVVLYISMREKTEAARPESAIVQEMPCSIRH